MSRVTKRIVFVGMLAVAAVAVVAHLGWTPFNRMMRLVPGLAAGAPSKEVAEAARRAVIAEPNVQDAMWSQRISLWVTLGDDATRRRGYGAHLCKVLRDHGVDGYVVISMMDAKAGFYGRQLDSEICR